MRYWRWALGLIPLATLYPLGYGAHYIATINPKFDTSRGALRLLRSPGDPGMELTSGGRWFNDPHADSERIWLGNDTGIYLFTQSTGLRKVYGFKANATLGESLIPAGFCR